jgi:hypothetical protein
MLRPTVSRLVCLGIKHPSGAYDQIFITVRQLRISCCGALSWREEESVVYNCCCSSPGHSFSGPRPAGLATIFYTLRFETSLFVASYNSQGYGGGIWPRLHTGNLIFQSQSYFTTGGLPPISSSWRQATWDSRPEFFTQLNTCGCSPYITSSLTRRWACLLWIYLVFIRVRVTLRLAAYRQSVLLGTEPLETHGQNFFPQINTCGHSPYITSSLTRGWVRHLQFWWPSSAHSFSDPSHVGIATLFRFETSLLFWETRFVGPWAEYIVIWRLKSGIVEPQSCSLLNNGSVNTFPRQRIRKQQSRCCWTIMLETVFSVGSAPSLYKEDPRPTES